MRGRATARLRAVIRGVVSDAVLCRFNGVICDLPFNVVGLPKKMGSMIAYFSIICQSPLGNFFAHGGGDLRYTSRRIRSNPVMKSWNETRKAATAFSKRWKNAYDENGRRLEEAILDEGVAFIGRLRERE